MSLHTHFWNPQAVTLATPEHLQTVIIPRAHDLGGFEIRRALPSPRRQMVGPFIFFDQIGPAAFIQGHGVDIRPHPHIGLGTVTYLYQGEFEHRDSLGNHQMIYPGEVNWMLAGRGVTHSERTSASTRANPHPLFGIQTWIALPQDKEEVAPDFEHHAEAALPYFTDQGVTVRLILGHAWGYQAPVSLLSELFYADVTLAPGAALPLPDTHEDRGLHIVQGSLEVAGQVFAAGQMMIFRPGDHIAVRAGADGARLIALGGATLDGPRYIWWNFVSSSLDKIEAAKAAWKAADWQHGAFSLPPGDDQAFIPIDPEQERIKPHGPSTQE